MLFQHNPNHAFQILGYDRFHAAALQQQHPTLILRDILSFCCIYNLRVFLPIINYFYLVYQIHILIISTK